MPVPFRYLSVKKLDAYLLLLEKSSAGKYLKQINFDSEPGRPKIDQCRLFAAVLYCFALGKASLREMETACFTDLRIIYLIGDVQPSAASFSRFVTSLIPNMPAIFCDNNEAHLFRMRERYGHALFGRKQI